MCVSGKTAFSLKIKRRLGPLNSLKNDLLKAQCVNELNILFPELMPVAEVVFCSVDGHGLINN